MKPMTCLPGLFSLKYGMGAGDFAERRPTAISSNSMYKATKGIGGRSEANFPAPEARGPVSKKAANRYYYRF